MFGEQLPGEAEPSQMIDLEIRQDRSQHLPSLAQPLMTSEQGLDQSEISIV